ncbi:MAG: hypothetical protein HOP36_08600 [Methyloglobulus sp.]|nr:hypothetical protein [Methyloglobulus sp.]
MKNNIKIIIAIVLFAGGMVLPTLTQAAIPRAMLEKSTTYALDNTFHGFRVPTVDSVGAIRYYDVKVNLVVNADGSVSPNALVTSALSPTVGTVNVVPGTYQEFGGTDKCTVTNMKLLNGRTQSFFKCNNAANIFEFSVVTGPITAGHPFQTELLNGKVNLRTDVATQTWGMVTTNNTFTLGPACTISTAAGILIGAKTNGSQLVISVMNAPIGGTAAPTTKCGNTLTKLP